MIDFCRGDCSITDLTNWVLLSVLALSALLGFLAGGD